MMIANSRRFLKLEGCIRNDEEGNWVEDNPSTIVDEQAEHVSHVAGMVFAREVMETKEEVASK